MKRIVLSNHSKERLFEREHLKEAKAQNYAERAWRNGKGVQDYTGKMRRRLQEIEEGKDKQTRRVVRVFANGCYLFSPYGVLITEFPMSRLNKPYRHKQTYFAGESYEDDYYDVA